VATAHDPNRIGNVAELTIAAEAAKFGFGVYQPLTEHGRSDLVLEIGGRLLRVQCKTAKLRDGVVVINLATSRRTANGYARTNYTSSEVDAIAAYCDPLRECFLIPIAVVDGQHAVRLRVSPARNGQRAALKWAEHYRLGAVAQLEERRAGSAKVRGSSPLSSTSQVDPAVEEVGAHEFRNHFGVYMERAAAGGEILIRRRGRPYARLGPPDATGQLG
jgi:prevent-host-death family protein